MRHPPLAQGERGEAEQYHGHTPHDQVVRPRLAVSPAVALLVRVRVRVRVTVRARVGVTVGVRVRVR